MKRSLSFYMIGLVIAVAIAVIFATSILLRVMYLDGAINRARTVSENVNAFGDWVSQYGRVYVKDGRNNSFLGHEAYRTLKGETATPFSPKNPTAITEDSIDILNLYSKNPALAQREFSEAIYKSEAKAKFRLTSDNVMNPGNAPDLFEQTAIKKMKTEKLSEYSMVMGKELRYASALTMKESCLKCHASAEAAPKDVTSRYGVTAGYGFKEGELGGIISVRVPLDFSLSAFSKQFHSMGIMAYLAVGLVLCALIAPLVFLKVGIINRIREMTQFAEAASMGRASNDALANGNEGGKNEIGILGASIKRMNSSLQIAMAKLRDRP